MGLAIRRKGWRERRKLGRHFNVACEGLGQQSQVGQGPDSRGDSRWDTWQAGDDSNSDKATKPASRSTSQPSGLASVPYAPSASVPSVIKMKEVIKCTPESTVSIKGADACKVSRMWCWISATRCGLHGHLVRPVVCVASCFSTTPLPESLCI